MRYILFIILYYFFACGWSQDIGRRSENTIRICFYNLENFFDYKNNAAKNDTSFTPNGNNHWTKTRFENKAKNIAKVFIALGQWNLPEIIGVCEIENESVIRYLLYNTPLSAEKYEYVYYKSPDRRGINVALFYKSDKFNVINSYPIRVKDSLDFSFKTRDILYVQGVLATDCEDTLHLFVNHWASRYGGQAATMGKRNLTASILRLKIDSLLQVNSLTRILIMGDFNDYPDDESITSFLRATCDTANSAENTLINMMYSYLSKNNIGTHKYKEHWGILDQIIVSQGFFRAKNGLQTVRSAAIFNADFLLEEDIANMGKKPKRTYSGFKYIGGFSDHLPVYIDLICD